MRPAYVQRPIPGIQSRSIVKQLLNYEYRLSMIVDFDEAMSDLVVEASADRYEEALANLGSYLGFETERPELMHGVGPDVLWRTDAAFDFVIEAKSKKKDDNPLYKKDHAQLLEAENWFKATYPERNSVRVSALPKAIADDKATTTGSYALRLGKITELVGELRNVLNQLVLGPSEPDALRERCEAALQEANLKPKAIQETFMDAFEKAS